MKYKSVDRKIVDIIYLSKKLKKCLINYIPETLKNAFYFNFLKIETLEKEKILIETFSSRTKCTCYICMFGVTIEYSDLYSKRATLYA